MKIAAIRTTPLALPFIEPYYWAGRVDRSATVILVEVETNAGIIGIVACVVGNLVVRTVVKRRADAQEERVRREAEERMHPEEFATEDA